MGYNFKIFKLIKGDKNNEPEDYSSEGDVSTKDKFIYLNYSKPSKRTIFLSLGFFLETKNENNKK